MSTLTSQQLWQRLRENSLVVGEMPAPGGSTSPWFVRVMLGIAGWIGAAFLLGFVGVGFAFIMKSAIASTIVGGLCCVAAWIIFRKARDNDFGMQFGLAVSLSGQVMVIIGLFEALGAKESAAYFSVFIFLALLAAVVPNFLHRVLTSWGAVFALSLAAGRLGLHALVPALAAAGCAAIWLNELRGLRGQAQEVLWRPIGYGMALGLLQIDAINLFGDEFWRITGRDSASWLQLHAPWIGTALVAAVFLWVVRRLLAHQEIAIDSGAGIAALVAAVLVAALSFAASGIDSALMILLLGFATGNRILMGLGLLALGGFVSHYYYQLQHTLMFKSGVLAVSGVVLLLARLLLQKCFPAEQELKQVVLIRENGDA